MKFNPKWEYLHKGLYLYLINIGNTKQNKYKIYLLWKYTHFSFICNQLDVTFKAVKIPHGNFTSEWGQVNCSRGLKVLNPVLSLCWWCLKMWVIVLTSEKTINNNLNDLKIINFFLNLYYNLTIINKKKKIKRKDMIYLKTIRATIK